jgi:hypothetical protein
MLFRAKKCSTDIEAYRMQQEVPEGWWSDSMGPIFRQISSQQSQTDSSKR